MVSVLLLGRLCWRACGVWHAPVQPFAAPVQIDVNTARVPELMALDGIGRVRAEEIVLYRVRHGPFREVDGLLEVDGIGQETVARLRPFLRDPRR